MTVRGANMADEQEENSLEQLIRQLINEECIVMLEKLSTDLDYIELDTSNHFHTNVIFYPKNLNDNLIKEISKRIREKVIDATQNIRNEEIVLVPLIPDTGDFRSNFLHDGVKIKEVIDNTKFNFVDNIGKLKEGQNVVVVSFNFIGEALKLPDRMRNKTAKLVKVIFILGIPPFVRENMESKIKEIEYDEIIPINTDSKKIKLLNFVDLLLNPEKGER